MLFFFNDTATTEIYTYCHPLSLLDALPIFTILVSSVTVLSALVTNIGALAILIPSALRMARKSRSEEQTSELQTLMRAAYAVFCLKKKKKYMTSNAQIIQQHESRKKISIMDTT